MLRHNNNNNSKNSRRSSSSSTDAAVAVNLNDVIVALRARQLRALSRVFRLWHCQLALTSLHLARHTPNYAAFQLASLALALFFALSLSCAADAIGRAVGLELLTQRRRQRRRLHVGE